MAPPFISPLQYPFISYTTAPLAMLTPPILLPAPRLHIPSISLRPPPATPVSCAPRKIPRPPETPLRTSNTGSSPPYPAQFRRYSYC